MKVAHECKSMMIFTQDLLPIVSFSLCVRFFCAGGSSISLQICLLQNLSRHCQGVTITILLDHKIIFYLISNFDNRATVNFDLYFWLSLPVIPWHDTHFIFVFFMKYFNAGN